MAAMPVTVPDLVCGAEVHPSTSAVTWDHAGERFYFCSERCRQVFVMEPGIAGW